jgi:hypothetical protein
MEEVHYGSEFPHWTAGPSKKKKSRRRRRRLRLTELETDRPSSTNTKVKNEWRFICVPFWLAVN